MLNQGDTGVIYYSSVTLLILADRDAPECLGLNQYLLHE